MSIRRGLTLLELVVALAVGGAALAAGGAAFSALIDRRTALLADADVVERSLTVRRMLVAWISEARAGTASGEGLVGVRGTLRVPSGELGDDLLEFVTMADGVPQRVRLSVDRTGMRSSLTAELTAADGATARFVLAPDVAGFEASFATSAFGRQEWRRDWPSGALLPTAVVLRLRAHDGTALPSPLRMPITIPLANSQ